LGLFFLAKTWLRGFIILVLLIITAFIGYVLPWGQMSFWGATVITNLLTAVPYIGKPLTLWVWGGFSVDRATLRRFYCFHFVLPFVIILVIFLHIIFLHEKGSRNPLGFKSKLDIIPFNPYFFWKDFVGFIVFIWVIFTLCLLFPFSFIDCDNFIPANPIVTPPHIQPEWYFLFAYAILRSIPNKLGGVCALFASLLILLLLLLIPEKIYFSSVYINKYIVYLFWWFCANFLFLTYLGSCPVEVPFVFLAQIRSLLYFSYFFLITGYSLKLKVTP